MLEEPVDEAQNICHTIRGNASGDVPLVGQRITVGRLTQGNDIAAVYGDVGHGNCLPIGIRSSRGAAGGEDVNTGHKDASGAILHLCIIGDACALNIVKEVLGK